MDSLKHTLAPRLANSHLPQTFDNNPISCHDNAPKNPPPLFNHHQCLRHMNIIYCHINTPTITVTQVIYELIDKLSGELGGNHDDVDHAIGNRLNKVIVGVKKESKVMCK